MKEKYQIYGILYTGADGTPTSATVAAENKGEAENLLEKAVVEGKGYEYMKERLDMLTKDTGFKTAKKGLIFGYDGLSGSFLD